MSKTRTLAKEAALKLLRSGQRPTADRVRAAIGQGSQQTILGALDEFWQEIGERLREPRLPDVLVEPVTALWSQAIAVADQQWQGERTALTERLSALERREQSLVAELQATTVAKEQADTRAAKAEASNDRLEERLAKQTEVRQALEADVSRLAKETGQQKQALDAEREARDRDQVAWMKQIDAARLSTKQALAERDQHAGQLRDARATLARQDLLLSQADERAQGQEDALKTKAQACAAAEGRAVTLAQRAEQLADRLREIQMLADQREARIEALEARSKRSDQRLSALQLEREGLLGEHRALRDELKRSQARRDELDAAMHLALTTLKHREPGLDEPADPQRPPR